MLFVGLLAAAVVQLAGIPFVKTLGFSPLVIGIVCGMLYGNFLRGSMPAEWGAGVHFTARRLLRVAVAFYGLNISIQQIIEVGLPGLVVSVGIVVGVLVLGTVIGTRVLKLDRDTAMLTASGSAVCGAAVRVHTQIGTPQKRCGRRNRGSVRHDLHVLLPTDLSGRLDRHGHASVWHFPGWRGA